MFVEYLDVKCYYVKAHRARSESRKKKKGEQCAIKTGGSDSEKERDILTEPRERERGRMREIERDGTREREREMERVHTRMNEKEGREDREVSN